MGREGQKDAILQVKYFLHAQILTTVEIYHVINIFA